MCAGAFVIVTCSIFVKYSVTLDSVLNVWSVRKVANQKTTVNSIPSTEYAYSLSIS
jgi:hypothetical protein